MTRFLRFFALLSLALASIPAASAKPPPWLTALAARPASMDYGDASHAVLLDESEMTIDKHGTITQRSRYVIRVLTKDGRDHAVARLNYDTSSDKVRSFQAWLLPPHTAPIDYGKKHIVDIASYSNARELYGEARQRLIFASDAAIPGSVFAYESVTTEKSIYTQHIWGFQQSVPVEYSGFTLTLPEGWTARTQTFNHSAITPVVAGQSQTWALRNLAALASEPLGVDAHARAPRLAIDIVPAGSTAGRVSFDSWQSISEYFTPFYETASTPDAAIKARADALVAGAATPWEHIARLCRFAQQITYVSINLNTASAGGMIPRPASRVLQCNYGDCKDKSAFLRALLRTQSIVAHPVTVYSGDSSYVRPEWPSPFQFNHCIIAIPVDESVDAPGVIVDPELGRLLLFDPTNEFTPPGWLAQENLFGHGLILAGSRGRLVQLPGSTPQHHRIERSVVARLDPYGAIAGSITELFEGHSAGEVRSGRRALSETDYRTKIIEPWLSRTLPSSRVTNLKTTDEFDAARFSLSFDFEARTYGRMMRDTLLVFKPVIVARRDYIALKRGKRSQPIHISPLSLTEKTEIELPPGYTLDESIPATDIQTSFGFYRSHAEVREGRLYFERTHECLPVRLPAEEFESVRSFFEKILQAEQSPVVLRRI